MLSFCSNLRIDSSSVFVIWFAWSPRLTIEMEKFMLFVTGLWGPESAEKARSFISLILFSRLASIGVMFPTSTASAPSIRLCSNNKQSNRG